MADMRVALTELRAWVQAVASDAQSASVRIDALLASIAPDPRQILTVAWLSQNAPLTNTDDYSSSDCGPACVAMWLRSIGCMVTVDEVSRSTGLPAGYKSTTYSHLIAAAAAFDLHLQRNVNVSADDLRDQIRSGSPAIALVHYGSLDKRASSFIAGHWIVVVGFEGRDFFYHDPLFLDDAGARVRISETALINAMADARLDGNLPKQVLARRRDNA